MRSNPVRIDVPSSTSILHVCESEGSGETARMRRLAWAFAGRLCDKYHNLISWLIYLLQTCGHTWKSVWGALEGCVIHLYTSTHKVKENVGNSSLSAKFFINLQSMYNEFRMFVTQLFKLIKRFLRLNRRFPLYTPAINPHNWRT